MSRDSNKNSISVLAPINQQHPTMMQSYTYSNPTSVKSGQHDQSCRAESILKSKANKSLKSSQKGTPQKKELDISYDLNSHPNKPGQRMITQPTLYANKPMYAKQKQFQRNSSGIGYAKASQYQKYNKLTPSGLSGKSSNQKSEEYQKRIAQTQADIELLGGISIFNPGSAEKQNDTWSQEKEIRKIQKEHVQRESKILMKNADKQQISLLNNPQYIRKAPKRINSAVRYKCQQNTSQQQINSHRCSEITQEFQRLEKSFSNVPLTENGEIISECLRGLQQYKFDESSPLNQSNQVFSNAPKKKSFQNKKGQQRYNSSYAGRNNTTSCSRLAPSSTYNTAATHTNIMVNGGNILGIKQQQLRELNLAKCRDLQIFSTPQQQRRFFEYCRRNIRDHKLHLREIGLGTQAASTLAHILRNNTYFVRLDIRKNQIGNPGLRHLIRALHTNQTLQHLDLGSNDLTFQSCTSFFDMLRYQSKITSVDFSNCEGMHRNKLGHKTCSAIARMLSENQTLTALNVSDNSLGCDGVNTICQGLAQNKSLLELNISQNEVGYFNIFKLKHSLSCSTLKELNLSYNKLNDKAMEDFSSVFYNNGCMLERLDISYNQSIGVQGVTKLMQALRSNTTLQKLNIEHITLIDQQTGGSHFLRIGSHLKSNRGLKYLNFTNCGLRGEDCIGIADGLSENNVLETLILEKNPILSKGAIALMEALESKNKKLNYLDITSCDIDEESVNAIIKVINSNTTLQTLLLKDNKLCGESGQKLCPAIVQNRTLIKVTLQKNSIKHKHLKQINQCVLRNSNILKKSEIPKIKKQIDQLQKQQEKEMIDNGFECFNEQDLEEQMEDIRLQREIAQNELKIGQQEYQHILLGDMELDSKGIPNGIKKIEMEFQQQQEEMKRQQMELDQELVKVNEAMKDVNSERKKEIASWKFKYSNGQDSLSIAQKKLRTIKRQMNATHKDKIEKLLQLQEDLKKEKGLERQMEVMKMNYERQINRIKDQRQKILQAEEEEEQKKRPASADSPVRSIKGSPKTRRPFGVGHINSQNVYFRQAPSETNQQQKPSKKQKKKMASISLHDKKDRLHVIVGGDRKGELNQKKKHKSSNKLKKKEMTCLINPAIRKKLHKPSSDSKDLKLTSLEVMMESKKQQISTQVPTSTSCIDNINQEQITI